MRRIGIVEAAVTLRPFLIPRTRAVRDRIIFGRLFANPENRRHDALFPRITFTGRWGRGSHVIRREHERIDSDDRFLRFGRSLLRLLTKFCFARLRFSHRPMREER